MHETSPLVYALYSGMSLTMGVMSVSGYYSLWRSFNWHCRWHTAWIEITGVRLKYRYL